MKTVVFVDRAAEGLRPLSDRCPLALLPVVGKPVAQHTIEDLVAAGIRAAIVVSARGSDAVEQYFRDGRRWGLSLRHETRSADETTPDLLRRLDLTGNEDLLLIRGDVLRTPSVRAFLDAATATTASVAGRIGGEWAGISLHRAGSHIDGLFLDDPGPTAGTSTPLDLPGQFSWLRTLSDYHAANLAVANGRFPGLLIDGRDMPNGARVGSRTEVSTGAVVGSSVVIGARCRIAAGAELVASTVVGDDVLIDRGATLENAVVLPGTYVGEGVDVRNAIVWGKDLIRVDTGAAVKVPDDFLLAELTTSTATGPGGFWQRVRKRVEEVFA